MISAIDKAHPLPRIHVASSTASVVRKASRASVSKRLHAGSKSDAGSPIASISKSITALSLLLCTNKLVGNKSPCVQTGGLSHEDPDDEKKRQRDQARKEYRPPTNKEARESANDLRYRETRDHPCGDTHGKPVFTNGKNYISPDADGHSGAAWKMFNLRGAIQYAMDENLIEICRVYG